MDSINLKLASTEVELIEMKQQGYRSILLFAVLHSGIERVQAAGFIDKKYANLFEQAKEAGVEVICYFPDLSDVVNPLI